MRIKRCCCAPVFFSVASVLTPLAALVFWSGSANGQPIPDNTVGTEITPFDPDTSIIDGGITVEQNLFHSFESFSIAPGKRVFFFGPDSVEHIFSRVTGNSPSKIDGVLGTFGSDADLFLINPNGVVFGPEASLSVQGSFIVTTAAGIQLGEAGQFSATTPTADSLLAVNPSAFFFSSFVNDQLTIVDSDLDDRFPTVIQTAIGIEGIGESGDISISANNIDIRNGFLLGGMLGNGSSGDIEINAQGRIRLINGSVGTDTGPSSIKNGGGNITISANALELLETSGVITDTAGIGDAGDIKLNIRERIVISGNKLESSIISSEVEASGIGDGGDIEIVTTSLEIINVGQISALTEGVGDAGNITINVSDFMLDGERRINGIRFPSSVLSFVGDNAKGEGGNVEILTDRLTLTNGAVISNSSFGEGPAGNINIQATDYVRLNQSDFFSESLSDSPAGNLVVSTDRLFLENESFLSTATTTVDGGDIFLTIDRLLLLRDRSNIIATAGNAGLGGDGGNITITTPFIVAIPTENSDITANAFAGSGGQVNIIAQGVFGIEPRPQLTSLSDITASSQTGVSGIVTINSLDTNFIQNNLTTLPEQFINSDTLISNSCVERSQTVNGTFTIARNSLAETPNNTASVYSISSVQPLNPSQDDPEQFDHGLIEPSGIYRTVDGRLVMSQPC